VRVASQQSINNDIYHALGERWYNAQDDPVALLRAEARLRNPWVAEELRARFAGRRLRILDVGCGGGFLSNYLAIQGHTVIGLDFASDALKVARLHDATGRVEYIEGDAYRLPFTDGGFDAVCSMDFLEHVEEPELAIREAAGENFRSRRTAGRRYEGNCGSYSTPIEFPSESPDPGRAVGSIRLIPFHFNDAFVFI
jgi:2-polyprenyl-6-hydroxyphenyl methylase / 3-demethylubiquinone-9 3-methyltransferase